MSERIRSINFEIKSTQELSSIFESLANSKGIITSKKILEAIIANKTSEGAGALGSLVGKSVLSAPKTKEELKKVIAIDLGNGKSILGDKRLFILIQTAMAIAGKGNILRSGDIIIAESELEDSIVLNNLKPGIKPNLVRSVVNTLRQPEFANRYPETGSKSAKAEAEIDLAELPVLDLINAAKDGYITEHLAKPAWIKSVLSGLEGSDVVAINTQSDQEVFEAMQGLAMGLAGSTQNVFRYKTLVSISPELLERNPELTISQAVESAKGGILYLPRLENYLQYKAIRTAIASKSIKIVTTTPYPSQAEYRKSDPLLNKSNLVKFESMTSTEAAEILTRNKGNLEKRLGDGFSITISNEALKKATELALMYQSVLGLPTIQGTEQILVKAIFLLKLANTSFKDLDAGKIQKDLQVDPMDVEIAFTELTGIETIATDPEKYLHMEDEIAKRVAGQPEAIKAVSDKLRVAMAGIRDNRKPLGIFTFFGPSGTGKSELGKALAEFLFGSDEAMIQVDMASLLDESDKNRLIGSPQGYEGSKEGGFLTEAVSARPYAVICFDEYEKAHPSIQKMFLNMMNDGFMTDGRGRRVDFRNTVIIMTSNAGSGVYAKESELGKAKTLELAQEIVKKSFPPELLNRSDSIVYFNTLTKEVMKLITDIQLKAQNKLFGKTSGITLETTPEARLWLSEQGYVPEYGARPLNRLIDKFIKSPLATLILSKRINPGDTALVTLENNQIVLRKK